MSFLLTNYLGKNLGVLFGIFAGILMGWKQFRAVAFVLGLATGLCVILAAQQLSVVYKFPNPFPLLLLASVMGWRIWRQKLKLSSGTVELDQKVWRWRARGHLVGMVIMFLRWILP